VLLSCSSTSCLPLSFLLLFLFLESELLLLVLLLSLVLHDHCLAMESCLASHREVKKIVKVVDVVALALQIEVDLAVELRDELAKNAGIPGLSENALINHDLKGISFEHVEELFSRNPRNDLLVSVHLLHAICPLLQVPALAFVHATLASRFHTLGLHKLGLLHLQEETFMLS
jgi:hypothetical protein